MCELKVIINNELVFENAILAKTIDDNVIIRDIMGKTKEFKNHTITEVNIGNEKLTLSPTDK